MASWHDRHVLITGGSSGIGLAFGELAAERGAHVTLLARDVGRLEAAREAVAAARVSEAQRVSAVPADVTSWQSTDAAIRQAEEIAGPVDVLVTSAGYCHPARFVEMPIEQIEGQVNVDLLGTLHAARAAAPGMVERGRGHIVLLSSMGGIVGVYGYAPYSAAKFGVMGLAEVLRCELKPHGVGVSVVCPPNVDTPGYAREREIEPPETARINGAARTASPRSMAVLVADAIDRRRFVVVPGLGYRLLRRVKGLVPEIFYASFDRDVAAARKEASADVA